jgi:hypothetical protein
MVLSVRLDAFMFLLMAARVLGLLPSLTRSLPFSSACRHRGAPVAALPECCPVVALSKRSLDLRNAPAPAASWIAGCSVGPPRLWAWVLPLRSRYRRLGRSRGAMSGARRATVVIPGSLPEHESRPHIAPGLWFALPAVLTRSAPR